MQNNNKKVEYNKNDDRFSVFTDNAVIKVKYGDETEVNNDECEEIKEKGAKTNDKFNKIRKSKRRKESMYQNTQLEKTQKRRRIQFCAM